jgi:lipopolysaccharide export system ATP-binding protein
MSVLAIHRLGKRYQSRVVVDSVSLSVKTGEVAGLLGPNGAGKTTCFYMIVGLIPCPEGSITLDDMDLTLMPMHGRARHGLGYLPQEPSIFRKMTVAENILSVLEIRPGLNRQQRHELLESLMLDIQQIIRHLCNRNIGVLITDHNVRETLGICDHAYILNKGQVIAEGPPQAILNDKQVRRVYLGADFRL